MLRDRKLPATALELIGELDAMYPPRCIEPGQKPEDAHRYAGRRDVVEFLKSIVSDQAATKPTDKILR